MHCTRRLRVFHRPDFAWPNFVFVKYVTFPILHTQDPLTGLLINTEDQTARDLRVHVIYGEKETAQVRAEVLQCPRPYAVRLLR